MSQAITDLPEPSGRHATCAWCRRDFSTILQLLEHIDSDHLDERNAA
jgi:hypothetical protein